jgi:hypothetical protein
VGGKRLLSSAEVAKLLGWRTKRARKWLQREGLGVKIGSRWFTTPTKLREAFPEVYEELVPDLIEGSEA